MGDKMSRITRKVSFSFVLLILLFIKDPSRRREKEGTNAPISNPGDAISPEDFKYDRYLCR